MHSIDDGIHHGLRNTWQQGWDFWNIRNKNAVNQVFFSKTTEDWGPRTDDQGLRTEDWGLRTEDWGLLSGGNHVRVSSPPSTPSSSPSFPTTPSPCSAEPSYQRQGLVGCKSTDGGLRTEDWGTLLEVRTLRKCSLKKPIMQSTIPASS